MGSERSRGETRPAGQEVFRLRPEPGNGGKASLSQRMDTDGASNVLARMEMCRDLRNKLTPFLAQHSLAPRTSERTSLPPELL